MKRVLFIFCTLLLVPTAATKYGSWGSTRPPLLDTWRKGDHLFLSNANNTATLDEMMATNQRVVGLGVLSCSDLEVFLWFAGNASARNLSIEIFAVLGSHEPIDFYCPSYLSPDPSLPKGNNLNLNWTAVGEVVGTRAAAANLGSVFRGVYIDDAYVAICTARGGPTFPRGHPSLRYPCVPMTALAEMQAVMRQTVGASVGRRVDVIPLVYTVDAPEALPGGYSLGARYGAIFEPPMSVSIGFDIPDTSSSSTPPSHAASSCSLSFFYQNWLHERPEVFHGFGTFSVVIDGNDEAPAWSVDTHHGGALLMVNVSLPSKPRRSIEFIMTPTNKTRIDHNIRRTLRVTGLWGVGLSCGGQAILDPLTPASTFKGANETAGVITQSNAPSVAPGSVGTALFLLGQAPSDYVRHNYSVMMTIAKNVTDQAGGVLWAGKYSRVGLKLSNPVSAVNLKESIQVDTEVGIEASLVWNLPLPISRCRSKYDVCDQGVFSERVLARRPKLENATTRVLLSPGEHHSTPGWYQHYTSAAPVEAGQVLTIKVTDSLQKKGPRTHGLWLKGIFRKQVYLVHGENDYDSARMYLFNATMGYPGHTSSSGSSLCLGASPGVKARCVNSGKYDSTTTLTVKIADGEAHEYRLVVELALASGASNAAAMLLVTIPKLNAGTKSSSAATTLHEDGWLYKSGLYDIMHPTTRALYNATMSAFGVSGRGDEAENNIEASLNGLQVDSGSLRKRQV